MKLFSNLIQKKGFSLVAVEEDENNVLFAFRIIDPVEDTFW